MTTFARDGAATARETPLEARRRHLAAYLYSYTRTMELECAWVALVDDTTFKIALGRKIGLDGLAIERLSRRLGQLLQLNPTLDAPATYAEWLSSVVGARSVGQIGAVLLAVVGDLERSMRGYLDAGRDGDEPSLLIVQALLNELARARAILAPFSGPPVPATPVDGPGPTVGYQGSEPLPPLVDFPAREAVLRRQSEDAPTTPLPLLEAMKPVNVGAQFHRMLMDVEIAATEVCARNVIDFRDMPAAFKVDMSQQIWDETRHAELALSLMARCGVKLGDLPYTGLVWTRHRLGRDLAERLAIEQVVQEGNSVDKALLLVPILRKFGHEDAAEVLEWITADETQHAAIGNRWLTRLCPSRERYEQVVDGAAKLIKFPLSRVDRVARALGGFPEWYVDKLEQEFAASRTEGARP